MDGVSAEMPRYQCHKQVHALKIAEVRGTKLIPVDGRYAEFRVSDEYIKKHGPQAGGYFVVYDDGYQSFSPAEAFESGYTLVTA